MELLATTQHYGAPGYYTALWSSWLLHSTMELLATAHHYGASGYYTTYTLEVLNSVTKQSHPNLIKLVPILEANFRAYRGTIGYV